MPGEREKGQAIILVLVGLSSFLIGAIALAIDGSHLYAQRQMAQNAADAAAEGGVMSVFNKTNTGPNAFGSAAFTCTTGTDVRTPCVYARLNGFGVTATDRVDVDFPGSVPGVALSPTDNPALIGVTMTRTINTGLMRFLGTAAATVRARAVAAIVDVVSPVPILVLHPTMPGSFSINGNPTIKICGGPTKSIQVNSSSSTSIQISGGSSIVDLSQAGPKNWTGPNSCNGLGADFGDFGGPTAYPGSYNWGTDGKYLQPASPITDPLIGVPAPATPGNAPLPVNVAGGTGGCPLPVGDFCKLYSPGRYPSGITIKNEFALFRPGLYYLSGGGFHLQSNGEAHMAPCLTASEAEFGCGMVVYNAGTNVNDIFEITANSGQYKGVTYGYTFPDGTACAGNCLLGATDGGTYKGILFFQSHTAGFRHHNLQGGGGLVLRGTIYLSSTEPTMRANPGTYNWLELHGNPGSTTRILGMIIVDRLELAGNAAINMTLDPDAKLHIRQVALVR